MSCYGHYPHYGHLFPINTNLVILTTDNFRFTGRLDAVICFGCKDGTGNYCCNTSNSCNPTYPETGEETLIKLTVTALTQNDEPVTFPTEAYINVDQIIAIGRA